MSSPPMRISVVLPCFDEERRIGTSLAVLSETLEGMGLDDWEVLVVDDASVDRTAAIVKDFAAEHQRVHLVVATGGKGKGAAVRTGVMLARCHAVLVVDADLAGDLGAVDDTPACLGPTVRLQTVPP